jgi:hypothetical protein
VDIAIFVDQFRDAAGAVVAVFQHAAARVDAFQRPAVAIEFVGGAVARRIDVGDGATRPALFIALRASAGMRQSTLQLITLAQAS